MGHSEYDPGFKERRAWNAGRKLGAKRALKPQQVGSASGFHVRFDETFSSPLGSRGVDLSEQRILVVVALAPVPDDEVARLGALRSYDILDTAPDGRFDLFTRLCTWLFDTPLSAINLVDADRTFFKSLTGLAFYEPLRCTSICGHAVGMGDAVMVVEDLAQDPRFHDHPFVAKGIRFYAGAVLRSASGHALGTLCIAGPEPRRLTPAERDKLLELAGGVGSVLELHRLSVSLRQAASQDALTGLSNRRRFDEVLQGAVSKVQPGQGFALLCLDLDGFKTVNDTLGHAAGDEVLREVSRRLAGSVRSSEDIVARLGGDEFAVLMAAPATVECAEDLARGVLVSFAAPFALGGENVTISGSIGIATHPGDASDAAGLLRCADVALYEAKRTGRNRYAVYRAPAVLPPAAVA